MANISMVGTIRIIQIGNANGSKARQPQRSPEEIEATPASSMLRSPQPAHMAREGITTVPGVDTVKTIDIVLLHGLNGHPYRTWTNPKTGFFWPAALSTGIPSSRVMVYGYDTDISPSVGSNHTRIRSIAYDLLDVLGNERQKDDEISRPLVLIGHSLGGLVIKHALIIAARDSGNDRGEIYRSVRGVMFFGTPNAGSRADEKKRIQLLKNIAKAAFTKVPPKIESALVLHSDELLDLADDFRKIDICKHNRILIYSFYELLDTKLLGERVVDEFSARVGTSTEEALPINADHEDMVKYVDEADKNYKSVIAKVTRLQRLNRLGNDTARPFDRFFMISGHSLLPTDAGPTPVGALIAASMDDKPKKTSYFRIPTEKRVSKFVGRKHLLEEIATTFAPVISSQCTTPIKLALLGMGGIGKSQIALEYCFEAYRSKRFETIFWVNAQSEESVVASLTKVAALIGEPEQPSTNAEEKVEFVITSLQAWPCPFLLVFDSYDNPDFDNVLQYIPAVGAGAIIFTSRLFATGGLFDSSIAVDVMDASESMELLMVRCGLISPLAAVEENNAKEIVRTLDGLPLAIDQAGAYIRASGSNISFRRFLDHYSQRRRHILQYIPQFWQYKEATNEKERGRHLSVYTTWDLSLKLLGSSPNDRKSKTHFLSLVAFLGGHRVSRIFFKTYCAKAGIDTEPSNDWIDLFRKSRQFDDYAFRDVIVELNNLSLIRSFIEEDLGDLHFAIHPLVREWIIFKLDHNLQIAYTSEVNKIMLAFFDKYESEFSPSPDMVKVVSEGITKTIDIATLGQLANDMLQETVAHVHACLKISDQFGHKFDGSGALELYYGTILAGCGEIEEAVGLWERVLEYKKHIHGPQHPEVFQLMIGISRLWTEHKIRTKGRESMEVLLAQMNATSKADHPDTFLLLSHLVILYTELGETSLAKASTVKLKDALQNMRLRRIDSSLILALMTARLLANTPIFTRSEKRLLLVDAENILNKALEKFLPGDSSTEARFSNFVICDLRLAQNRPAQAETVMQDFLNQERLRHGGRLNQDIILGGLSLARCHSAQQHWKAAVDTLTPVHTFLTQVVGPCHSLTSACAISLAQLWIRIAPKDLQPSNEIIDQLLEDFRKQFSAEDLRNLQIQQQIVNIYLNTGRFEAAFDLLEPLYNIHRDSLEPENEVRLFIEEQYAYAVSMVPEKSATIGQSSATIGQSLNDMYIARQVRFEARDGLTGALAMRNREKHAIFLSNMHKNDECLTLRKIQNELSEEMYGPDSEEFRQSSMRLARSYSNLQLWSEALSIYGKIHKVKEDDSGIIDDETLESLLDYARTNDKVKNYADAEKQYEKILRCRTAQYGPNDERTIESLSYLAHAICNQPNYDKKTESETIYLQLLEWYVTNHGPDSKKVRDAKAWLGNCLIGINKDGEAAKYYRVVNEWDKIHWGMDHEMTLTSLSFLVKALTWSKDFLGTLELFPRVLDWLNRTRGPTDEETLTTTFLLGDTYIGLNRFVEARDNFAKVLRHREIINGPFHGKTMGAVNRLCDVLEVLGDFAQAELYAVRKLDWYKAGGVASEEVLVQQDYVIGYLRVRQGKAAEAEEQLIRALAWKKEHLGIENPATLRVCFWHAQCQYALKNYEEAGEYYALVVEWKDHPESWNQYYQEARNHLELCKTQMTLDDGVGRLAITDEPS